MSLAVDRKLLKLWLPLTKNAKNKGSKDVKTTVYGELICDSEGDSIAPFPSYAYFSNNCFINADELNITNFTISWWEKPKTPVKMLDSWSLFLSDKYYITLYKTDAPKLSCFIKDVLSEPTFLDDNGDPVTNVCDGYWHFYALTYKLDENNGNNVFTLYKDTDFIGTAILGKEEEPLTFKSLNIGIVTFSEGATRPFDGYICDFRMYDYYMGIREIRERLAYNKKFDFMARSEEFNKSIKTPKPIFYDNSGINLFKLVSEKKPIIHGNSVVFNGDSRLTIHTDSKGGNEGLNMEKGFLSVWFIPYAPLYNISTIFIDSSSKMGLIICKDKSGDYKLLINCSVQPLETSFENIKLDTINNVLIEYDKMPIRVTVNGIPQSINDCDYIPDETGFCIGGNTKEDCSFFGEILKISIYGENCDFGFLEYCYRPTLNMLKNSLASTLQTDLKFKGNQYTIIDLFSSELPNESVKFVFYFTTEISEGQQDMCLMHFASQGFGIRLYYNNGPCVSVGFNDKPVLIGQFTVSEENKLSIEIKGEECICQINSNKPVVLNVGNLLEELTHNDDIIIGANNNYMENYIGYLNVLKIYYDDILSRKLISAEHYKRRPGLYDIKTDNWYFLEDGQ